MRKLLFFILILFVLLFIVDRAGGVLMKNLLDNSNEPFLSDLNYMINDMNEEALLFGTSKTLHGINPTFIEDSLGLTTYNCGISGGRNIYTQFMLLNYVLDRYVPSLIVLQIGVNDFKKERDPYQFKKLAHFYSKNEVCDSFLVNVNKDKGILVSHLYRYNEISKLIIIGLTPFIKEKRKKGFEPLDANVKRFLPPIQQKYNYTDRDIDSSKLEILTRFFKTCRNKKIQLILVTIPTYNLYQNNFYNPVKRIAKEYNIPLFDYNDNSFFLDKPEYFYDENHLNEKGAYLFSKILSHDLKTLIFLKNED